MTDIGAKPLTFDEWQALPETNQICEVVDGALVMPPSATDEHQWIVGEVSLKLRDFVVGAGIGMVLIAPRDVLIRRVPLQVRQPDILFLSAQRSGIRRPADLIGAQLLETPPDLVVEVLSPSNTRREIEERLADFRSIGVLEAWLVNFRTRTIEVLSLSSGADTTVTFGMSDTLRSEVLAGFTLPVADIFGPLLG